MSTNDYIYIGCMLCMYVCMYVYWKHPGLALHVENRMAKNDLVFG